MIDFIFYAALAWFCCGGHLNDYWFLVKMRRQWNSGGHIG